MCFIVPSLHSWDFTLAHQLPAYFNTFINYFLFYWTFKTFKTIWIMFNFSSCWCVLTCYYPVGSHWKIEKSIINKCDYSKCCLLSSDVSVSPSLSSAASFSLPISQFTSKCSKIWQKIKDFRKIKSKEKINVSIRTGAPSEGPTRRLGTTGLTKLTVYKVVQTEWCNVTKYFHSTTFRRQILCFWLHCMYLLCC